MGFDRKSRGGRVVEIGWQCSPMRSKLNLPGPVAVWYRSLFYPVPSAGTACATVRVTEDASLRSIVQVSLGD